jgi:hypothetical protein
MFARNTLKSDAVNRVCAEILPRALVKSDWTTSIASNRDSPGVCAAKFVHSFKVKQPNGSMTWKNADMKCQVGTVQNLKVIEEGRRQHAYFFLESKEGGFHLHPVHGELWNARKHVKAPKMDEKTKDETEGLSAAQRKKDREMQRVSRCRTPATCFTGSHGAFSVAGIRLSSSCVHRKGAFSSLTARFEN